MSGILCCQELTRELQEVREGHSGIREVGTKAHLDIHTFGHFNIWRFGCRDSLTFCPTNPIGFDYSKQRERLVLISEYYNN